MEEIVPIKRGRGRPPRNPKEKSPTVLRTQGKLPPTNFGAEFVEPGDNTKFLSHAMTIARMPVVNTNNLEEVRERINWYFELCIHDDMKPTVTGLCNSIKIDRKTLFRWKNEIHRDSSYKALVLEAYAIMEELWEHYMQNGKINPVSGIFLGKNNFGYQDKQDFVVTPNTTSEVADPSIIDAKYAELPDVED